MPSEPAGNSATVHAPKRGRKYFTLAEANRSLTYIARIVDDISACYRKALLIRERIERPHPEDPQDELRGDYDRSMDQLNDLVEELKQVGVELKDFEKGLIDFPAIHQDREVYLCWHRGEPEVKFWHEVDAGYAGRQDISQLIKAD